MKRLLLGFITLLAIGYLVLRFALGVAIPSPGDLFDVGGGMAAKLGCSARYVTGLSPGQIKADLESYSSAYGWISINYLDDKKRVQANLPPGATHSASYRPGIGCTLDIGNTQPLDEVNLPPSNTPDNAPNTGAMNALLQQQLTKDNAAGLNSRALLAMHNGSIVGEANAAGFDHTTSHLGWSMGKSLIAVLLGRLEQDGRLDVSETSLFPDWSDERGQISFEHLMQMSSGLKFDEVYAPGSDATRMLFHTYSAAAVARQQPAVHAPGTHFSYSSGTTNLLSALLYERLGGNPAAAYRFLHNALLKPLNMHHTIVESDPSGVFVGSSYVYASARDWARLGNLLVSGGTHNGEILLSKDWIKRATTANSSSNEPRYGYQLWLNSAATEDSELRWPDLPTDAFAMQGNRAQIVMMIPSKNVVFVRLGWSAGGYPYNEVFKRLLAGLPG